MVNMKNREEPLCDVETREEGKSLPFIPLDIIHLVLEKLPVKTLGRCTTVSKTWHALISDPKFIVSQFNMSAKVYYCNISRRKFSTTLLKDISIGDRLEPGEPAMYPFDDEFAGTTVSPCNQSTIVLGSCNGLLLMSLASSTLLWNPASGKYKVIACGIRDITRNKATYYISGLGYNSLCDEYKALIFVFERGRSNITIYFSSNRSSNTCGYGDWKKMDDVIHEFPYHFRNTLPWMIYEDDRSYNNIGITFNGTPHWAVSDYNVTDTQQQRACYNIILYFDMVEEKFERLPTPSSWGMYSTVSVAVFEGCLSTSNVTGLIGSSDIWSMKQYGVKESWTKMFVITSYSGFDLLPLVTIKMSDGIMFVDFHDIRVYHFITKTTSCVFHVGDFGVVHRESLVSP